MMPKDSPEAAPPARTDSFRHEIRNQLNVLVGALRLLEMTGVSPQQQKQVDLCRGAVDRITAAIDRLGGAGDPAFVARSAAELRALGNVTFLKKPFERSDLLRIVQILARTHRNLRLLAADDVPEVGWLLEALLASSRCTLEMVRDGASAVTRARDGAYDVILLDLEMPDTNGVEAARAIRQDEVKSGRDPVPILIVSGHDLEGALSGGGRTAARDDVETVRPDPEIAPLVPAFLQHRRADVARLESLIDQEDWDTVRSVGHKMKGTGRGYGFARISELGEALEHAGVDEDARAAREAVAALATYLDRVRVERSETEGGGAGTA